MKFRLLLFAISLFPISSYPLQDSVFFAKASETYRKQYFQRLFTSYEEKFGLLPSHSYKESEILNLRVGHHFKKDKRIGSLIEIHFKSKDLNKPNQIRIWSNHRVENIWDSKEPKIIINSQTFIPQKSPSETANRKLFPFSLFAKELKHFKSGNFEFWTLEFDSLPPHVLNPEVRKILTWHEREFFQNAKLLIFLNEDEYGLLF